MKIIFILLGIVVLTTSMFSAKVGVLSGVLKPGMIAVYENKLYVSEGPGELMVIPSVPNKIIAQKDVTG